MSKTVKTVIIVLLVAVLGIGAYFLITSQIRNSKKITFKEFETLITDDRATDGSPSAGEIDDR